MVRSPESHLIPPLHRAIVRPRMEERVDRSVTMLRIVRNGYATFKRTRNRNGKLTLNELPRLGIEFPRGPRTTTSRTRQVENSPVVVYSRSVPHRCLTRMSRVLTGQSLAPMSLEMSGTAGIFQSEVIAACNCPLLNWVSSVIF